MTSTRKRPTINYLRQLCELMKEQELLRLDVDDIIIERSTARSIVLPDRIDEEVTEEDNSIFSAPTTAEELDAQMANLGHLTYE